VQLNTWLAFALASSVLLAIPGPTIMTVVSYALSKGRSSKRRSVPGAVLGDFTVMTVSLLGAGAILAASATLFTILKFIGAIYLVWLGIQLWRSDTAAQKLDGSPNTISDASIFWNCYVVTALNPKSIVFFIAFVPQFVDVNEPALWQFVILEATFLALAALNLLLWDTLATRTRAKFRNQAALRTINRVGGGFLVAAGLLTASSSRGN
jgi:threonine/homoserine/homoserine lactone efflux protein